MTSQIRKILFLVFVTLFFVLSGLILPYAFGYKFNFSGRLLQRTGMFDIKTTPSGATIYLDDKKQTSWLGQLSGQALSATTPIKLKNVVPGTYQVRLELANYWPWEKQLVIKPGETTYLEDVYFFKKNQPTLLTALKAEDVRGVLVSPNRKQIAVLTKTQLKILGLEESMAPVTIDLPKNTSGALSWSPSGQLIAVGPLIVDWRNQTLNDLKKLGLESLDKLVWADDNLIFFQEAGSLKRLNLKNNELTNTDLEKNISDFTVKDGYLYLARNGNQSSLSAIKISDNKFKEIEVANLKNLEKYRFVDLGSDNLSLQELSSKKLYAITTKLPWLNDFTIKEIGALTVGQWVDSDKLILGNNFELGLWTKDANQTKLLTRISHPITAVAWHKSNNYIIFATDQTVNTLELDDRDTYNIATLLDLGKIDYPIFNRDGSRVCFLATISGQTGFYLLEI